MSTKYGIKISEPGKNVQSSTLDESFVDSSYSSLLLIDKQTIEFTASAGETAESDTETYAHGLGYAPFVIGYVSYTGYVSGTGQILPYVYSDSGIGVYVESNIGLVSTSTNIEIPWTVTQYLPGTPYPLSSDVDYVVTVYIYGFELGYET